MPLQLRRGTDTQRTGITPAAGEPIWVTDTSKLYVGDGTTVGGIEVSGGGGGGAPTNLSYLVLTASTSLSAERVLTIGSGLVSTDAGAGAALTIALGTHTHSAGDIQSGTVALARGGLAADISTTGGASHVLRQTAAGAAVSVAALVASDVGAAAAVHTHAAADVQSGTLALARGGANADLSGTGPGFLQQTAAGANVSVATLEASNLPSHTHAATDIQSGTLALTRGGLAADLSATGGSRQVLKQTAAGAAISVGTMAATELSNTGTPSTSTYLRGDMTWDTPPGGTGGGTKTYARFTPLDNQPQTSGYATFDTRDSGVAVLDFDSTSLEAATFLSALPEAAVTTNGLKVRLAWTADTVTNTDAVVWGVQFQRIDTTTDIDTDAFSNTVTATASASGTAGVPVITEITVTGTANLDSIVAGDFFRVRISRDGTAASDALTADACLVAVEIRDAT